MRRASVVVQWLTRLSWIAQLVMGLLLWTGNAAPRSAHIWVGFLFVVLLGLQAGIAAAVRVTWSLVLAAVVLGILTVYLGMTQAAMLPGEFHWVVQVTHLLVGLIAMGLAERLAREVQRRRS